VPSAEVERVETSCGECGFEWTAGRAATIETLRSFRSRFEALAGAAADTHRREALWARPEPGVWSPLEYAAHTRDAIGWYAERIERVTREHRPRLRAFDWDAACEDRRYADEEPTAVVRALIGASEALADRLAALDDEAWGRVGIGSDGGQRAVLELARRAVHEGVHHLHDIRRQGTG
jgi:hypothetical protein